MLCDEIASWAFANCKVLQMSFVTGLLNERLHQHVVRPAYTFTLHACRHALSLYTHISSITWDTACSPSHAKGAVSDRETHDIRAFELDADEATSFGGVNRIWELIG